MGSPLKLLLDEDSEARVLVQRLVKAGHNVTTVGEMGRRGEPDEAVLRLAGQAGRVLLTRNCGHGKPNHQ